MFPAVNQQEPSQRATIATGGWTRRLVILLTILAAIILAGVLLCPRIAQRGWETRKQSHIVWEQDRFRLGKPKIPEKERDVERKEKKCAESETMCRKKP